MLYNKKIKNINLKIILEFIDILIFPFFIYFLIKILFVKKKIMNKYKLLMGIGDWGLGIGDWGLGIGPNAQSALPINNAQSPIP